MCVKVDYSTVSSPVSGPSQPGCPDSDAPRLHLSGSLLRPRVPNLILFLPCEALCCDFEVTFYLEAGDELKTGGLSSGPG